MIDGKVLDVQTTSMGDSDTFVKNFDNTVHDMFEMGKKYNCKTISITSDMVNGICGINQVITDPSGVDNNEIISDRTIDLTNKNDLLGFI